MRRGADPALPGGRQDMVLLQPADQHPGIQRGMPEADDSRIRLPAFGESETSYPFARTPSSICWASASTAGVIFVQPHFEQEFDAMRAARSSRPYSEFRTHTGQHRAAESCRARHNPSTWRYWSSRIRPAQYGPAIRAVHIGCRCLPARAAIYVRRQRARLYDSVSTSSGHAPKPLDRIYEEKAAVFPA